MTFYVFFELMHTYSRTLLVTYDETRLDFKCEELSHESEKWETMKDGMHRNEVLSHLEIFYRRS